MRFYIQGQGSIDLTDNDFLAEGGEGKIYVQGDRVCKIYTDPNKVIAAAKLRELEALEHPNIIRPRELVLDKHNRPVGFVMQRVSNAVPLARLFTNDFRNRHGIAPEQTLKLVEAMRDTIKFIHDRRCLIVDGNEMNYLVEERDFTAPYFIDVDSYQTPGFPATVIMPSIRDWHAKQFSPLSDWFSFAVIACQLFVGIHPYKGTHPRFKKHDLEGRMKANASIFNKAVGLPSAVRDFGLIPSTWRDWFIALCEHGRREPPPQSAGVLQVLAAQHVAHSSEQIAVTLRRELAEAILGFRVWNGIEITFTRTHIHIGKTAYERLAFDQEVVLAPRTLTPLLLGTNAGSLQARNARTGETLAGAFKAERILVVDNTLYTVHHGHFTEIRVNEIGAKLLLSPGRVWKVPPHARTVLQSMLFLNVLGKSHLLLPFRPGSCQILATPELDGYRIIDGRWDQGVAMVVAVKNDCYQRFVFRFNTAHTRYDLRVEDAGDTPAVNFVTLANGVVVGLNGNDTLEIFAAGAEQNTIKTVTATAVVNNSMTLAKDGNKVLFFRGEKLCEITLTT